MTDQEWQEGIERALNAARDVADAKWLIAELVKVLPLRIAHVYTNKDQLGHFRVGPARDENCGRGPKIIDEMARQGLGPPPGGVLRKTARGEPGDLARFKWDEKGERHEWPDPSIPGEPE